uniref:Uncharacterized protein n=1 Tax=Plectus sambesii TaxID=2011161 RepID=A0A914WEL1_9BILA
MLFSDCRLDPRHLLFIVVLFVMCAAVALCDRYGDRFDDRFDDTRPMLSDRRYCFSCMSRSYLSIWDRLMHHYFPPKNFTEQCERPTAEVGVVRCETACFTVVEEEHVGAVGIIVGNRYMRGCLDRLLLFGIDPDLRDAMANVGETDQCRVTNRKLLSLVNSNPQPEPSSQPQQRASNGNHQRTPAGRPRTRQPVRAWQADLVVVCSCIGDRCNKSPMNLSRRASRTTTPWTILPLLLPSALLVAQFARRHSTSPFLLSN